MDPESSTSCCEAIGASWASLQCLRRPKQWGSLHGHCRYGRQREVMGLPKLEGCFAILEFSRRQRNRCMESKRTSRRRFWRRGQRTCYSRLPPIIFLTFCAWSGVLTTFDTHSPHRTVTTSTISNTPPICEAAQVPLVLPISRCHCDRTRRGCLVHTRPRSG